MRYRNQQTFRNVARQLTTYIWHFIKWIRFDRSIEKVLRVRCAEETVFRIAPWSRHVPQHLERLLFIRYSKRKSEVRALRCLEKVEGLLTMLFSCPIDSIINMVGSLSSDFNSSKLLYRCQGY